MRVWLAGLVLVAAACQAEEPKFARASIIASLDQAIGGPTANARVGDILLENDQLRAVIEKGEVSYLPDDVGGSLIDIDLVRPQAELRGGHGLDQLGQIAPMANLNVAQATFPTHVRITRSKNGAEVTVAAEAQPVFRILLALVILIERRFTEVPLVTNLYTEYELRPGERLVRMRTTVGFNVPFCPVMDGDGCNPECDDILYDDDCDCPVPARCIAAKKIDATPVPDRPTASMLDIFIGDLPRPLGSGKCQKDDDCNKSAGETCVKVTTSFGGELNLCRGPTSRDAGMLLGDLLIFGGQLSPFVRGIGYDTETDIRRLFDQGKDTLSEPLEVDAIFATGDKLSLGYLSPNGHILVPVFRGPFSLGTTHAATCLTSEPRCLEKSLVRFERWVSVGNGDVASAQAPLLAAAGQPTGTVRGTVLEAPGGRAVSGASVYALHDPRTLACDEACQARCGPATLPQSFEELRAANRCRTRVRQYPDGNSAVETFAKTDPGTDPIADGNFAMELPPGDYFLVAVDGPRARSPLVPVSVTAGGSADVSLQLPPPGSLEYVVYDETSRPGPVKVTIGRLPGRACASTSECSAGDECQAGSCAPPWGALVPLELGGQRPVDGILFTEHSITGRGTIQLPPGDYEVLFSRGPQYSIDRQRVHLEARRGTRVEGMVRRVVDRDGWISASFHVHAENSVDSGITMAERVASYLVEDIDFITSTDHDYITPYAPLIKEMGAADRLNTMMGAEITTQEYGHYLAYPLKHEEWKNGARLPNNNAVQWRKLPPQAIIDAARALRDDIPVIIDIPHPYEYFDYYQIDPVTLEPADSLLAIINPLLGPSLFSGDFEVMELANTKYFHRVRRATVDEVAFYSRGLDALIKQVDSGAIDQETFGARWLDLATESARRRLHRTVAEQEAMLDGRGADVLCLCGGDGECGAGQVCEPSTMTCQTAPGSPAPAPPPEELCRRSRGVIDDWFTMLNRGVFRTGVGGDDVHGKEAGFLRTMVRTNGTTPPFIQDTDIADALLHGRAIVTNGPMVQFTVNGAEIGDTIAAAAGSEVSIHVRVEKPTWYDVDRIEIYRNGHLIDWANGCDRARGKDDADPDTLPCIEEGDGVVVAWDETVTDKPDRDAWYVVLVYGLDGRSLAPVYESSVLAEINTPDITQRLFQIIPGLQEFKYPRTPSIFPTFPFAFTNPIWVDIGGDGWLPPQPPPSWCRKGDAGC